MKELEMVLEALTKMGDTAMWGFALWCLKEVVIYAFWPTGIWLLGRGVFNCINCRSPIKKIKPSAASPSEPQMQLKSKSS